MTSPTVAIVKSDFHDNHSSAWGQVWIHYCEEQNIKFDLIDWRSIEAFEKLASHDIVEPSDNDVALKFCVFVNS